MREAMGFVTAGGKSSRMGRNKAWLELGGRPLVGRAIDSLKPVCPLIAIIANEPGFDGLGLPVFADEAPGTGPLEAIRTAIRYSPTPFVMLVGCDLPFITSALLRFLLEMPGDWDAIVPLDRDRRVEPLCAVYSTRLAPVVTELIDRGARKGSSLIEVARTRSVGFDEISHLDGSGHFFDNINTPDDYRRAVGMVGIGGQGPDKG
jgi:molybdopterin-guanine dinucleotide biosynthesis protein A